MTTTVPQNIKGSKIAGRHTPTRSSLRHSRMLVINNKAFQSMYVHFLQISSSSIIYTCLFICLCV